MNNGQVFPQRLLLLEFLSQLGMGLVVFGYHQKARSILVNPVNNPWPQNTIDTRQVLNMIKQGIDQCS